MRVLRTIAWDVRATICLVAAGDEIDDEEFSKFVQASEAMHSAGVSATIMHTHSGLPTRDQRSLLEKAAVAGRIRRVPTVIFVNNPTDMTRREGAALRWIYPSTRFFTADEYGAACEYLKLNEYQRELVGRQLVELQHQRELLLSTHYDDEIPVEYSSIKLVEILEQTNVATRRLDPIVAQRKGGTK